MKQKLSLILLILCIVLAVGVGWFLCSNRVLKTVSEYTEKSYGIEEMDIQNIEQVEDGLLIGEDPQIIVTDVNTYVEHIRLSGTELQEEVQVFYTQTLEEDFSEEKSMIVIPKVTKEGCMLTLEKEVAELRIDFTGRVGTIYPVEEITVNPPIYIEWNLGVGSFCFVIGIMLGVCLSFLVQEGKNLKVYFSALKKYRFLLEDMVTRDIKLKYRRSVVGLLWSILNPLLMMVVITAVFQNLFRFEIENFAVYYLTGWVVYNFVTEATSGAMTSIIGASALIRKVYIPKYIFPMQKCVFSFVNMLFSLVALFVVMLVLQVKFTWYVLLIPIPLVLALVFAIGLGMILSTVAVFFRDMIHLYGIFTMVWMYLTPIIYPEEILVGVMQTIMKLNPLYYYVDYFRQLTLYGTFPQIESFVIMLFCSIVTLLLGIVVFKKKQDRFILFI